MRTVEFYAVIRPSKRWWKDPKLANATSRAPKLKENERAIKIKLELPDDWQTPTTIPLVIRHDQIQQPTTKAI